MAHRSSIEESEDKKKFGSQTSAVEKAIKDIRRATCKHHSVEDKIRVVLDGLRGEDSISAACRREGIAESLYYSWSKNPADAAPVPAKENRDINISLCLP